MLCSEGRQAGVTREEEFLNISMSHFSYIKQEVVEVIRVFNGDFLIAVMVQQLPCIVRRRNPS